MAAAARSHRGAAQTRHADDRRPDQLARSGPHRDPAMAAVVAPAGVDLRHYCGGTGAHRSTPWPLRQTAAGLYRLSDLFPAAQRRPRCGGPGAYRYADRHVVGAWRVFAARPRPAVWRPVPARVAGQTSQPGAGIMSLISRYVGRQVAAATLLVLVVLMGIDIISGVIDQAGDINHRYTLRAVLEYRLLIAPGNLYAYLPFAALIGCLAGLGTLATTSELVVIRTTGVSVRRILWMAIKPLLLITLAGALCAEYVGPPLKQLAESRRAIAMQSSDISISRY